jgi:hypothetical protein
VGHVWAKPPLAGVETAREQGFRAGPLTLLKTVVAAMSPWVQIPHPPQVNGP